VNSIFNVWLPEVTDVSVAEYVWYVSAADGLLGECSAIDVEPHDRPDTGGDFAARHDVELLRTGRRCRERRLDVAVRPDVVRRASGGVRVTELRPGGRDRERLRLLPPLRRCRRDGGRRRQHRDKQRRGGDDSAEGKRAPVL
jgi:hypothetical protein